MKDKEVILMLVKVEGNVSKAAEQVRSKAPTQAYRDNFDAIFGKQESKSLN